MASWKKVIVSGSDAELNQISASDITVKNIIVTGSGTLTVGGNLELGVNASAIPISAGGTGGKSVSESIANISGSDVGFGLFTASSATNARRHQGISSIGDAFVTASSVEDVRTKGLGLGDLATQNTADIKITTTNDISSEGTVIFSGSSALANNQFTGSFSGSFVGDGAGLTGVSTVASANDLTDVGIASLSNNQLLVVSNSVLHNLSISGGDITSAVTDGASAGTIAFSVADNKIGNSELKQDDDITLQSLNLTATGTGLDVDGNANIDGNIVGDKNLNIANISASAGAKISGVERTSVGGRSIGLFVENDVSASGFQGNFLEITSSVIITSASTEFGDALDDAHVFSGSLALTSSANVVLDAPKVIGGVGTTFSASIVDGLVGNFDTVNIDGGSIDGVTLGTNSVVTKLMVDSVEIDGATIGHTSTTDLITLAANNVTIKNGHSLTTNQITASGGKIDGVVIGGNDTAGYGSGDAEVYVTGSFTGSFIGDGAQLTGIVTSLGLAGDDGSDDVDLKTDTLTVQGGNGIATLVTDNKILLSVPTASDSTLGVSKFNTSNFAVGTAGDVTIKDGGIANAELLKSGISMSADSGTTQIMDLGDTIDFEGTTNEIVTTATSDKITFSLPDDVTIGDALTVTGNATIGGGYGSTGTTLYSDGNISTNGNVVIDGTLTVVGATTTIQSQDLSIEDNIIWLGSGSYSNTNAVDSGIVFERGNASTPNQYAAFFFDETANRFAVAPTSGSGLSDDGLSGATSLAGQDQSQYIMTVSSSTTSPSSAPSETLNGSEFGDASDVTTQVGQVRIQTDDDSNGKDGDIWIYS